MPWSKSDMVTLHGLVRNAIGTPVEAKSFKIAAKRLRKSVGACRMRFSRTNWETFFKNDGELRSGTKSWKQFELAILYNYRVASKLSFVEIGQILERSPISCERKFHNTDWKSLPWVAKLGDMPAEGRSEDWILKLKRENAEQEEADRKGAVVDVFADLLVGLARGNVERLRDISEDKFMTRLRRSRQVEAEGIPIELPLPFDDLKQAAYKKIEGLGLTYPKSARFGKGRYLVVGDSHGKHTRNSMFDLLETVVKELKVDKVVHVGHIFDDDDEISFRWEDIPNLVIVGMMSELSSLKGQKHPYVVYRDKVDLGDISVGNQYEITDFVNRFVGEIADAAIMPGHNTIVNSHRHEMFNTCTFSNYRLTISPGCLCDGHIIKFVKEVEMEHGVPKVRITHPFGYNKYNRQEKLKERWEQGMILVDVEADGRFTTCPMRVKKTCRGYTTAYFDKIIAQDGVFAPDVKMFINGDLHCDRHDPVSLDIQSQFCADYKPDRHVNLGDQIDNRALNHHMMKKTHGPIAKNFLDEVAASRHTLSLMREWAKESYLIIGNHERFILDFLERYPQLSGLFDFDILFGAAQNGIKIVPFKRALDFGSVKFVHGDQKLFGQNGSRRDKFSKTYGPNIVIGNIHYPSIRRGCYSVGFSGLADQGYNEVEVTQWLHGFAFCNVFDGQAFISLVDIKDGQCRVGGRTYAPKHPERWICASYKASLTVETSSKG